MFPNTRRTDLTRRSSRLVVPVAVVAFLTLGFFSTASPIAAAEPSAAVDVTESRTSEWNQWRGPNRDGTVAGSDWPSDLNGIESLWRVELGKGYPGPIVSADAVFVVESVDEETEQVRALARSTGEELWRTSWQGGMDVPFFARRNGDWVRSTPAFDGEALYVGGMQEKFFKLDAATGEVLWNLDFPKAFGTKAPDFGFSSSPLIDSGAVYVQAANSLVKLNADSGEVIWRALSSPGSMFDSGAFSSPRHR